MYIVLVIWNTHLTRDVRISVRTLIAGLLLAEATAFGAPALATSRFPE